MIVMLNKFVMLQVKCI